MSAHPMSWSFLGYVLTYGGAAVGCLVALSRARGIADDELRRGLVGLLASSGGWAAFQLGFLIAPTPALGYAAYTLSLIIGLTTIGAWLYFCSAYTGRAFHQNPTYRRAAVVVYLGIVGVKLTNPLHGLYFTTEFVTMPFPHVTVDQGIVHWVVTGLSYALAAIGFFMLYERFLEADYDTRPLGAVVAVTGLPVLLDIVGGASPVLLDINYEPLGVAVFAIGILYVFRDRFVAVQLTEGVDDPVVYLDTDGRIREFNDQARAVFPTLEGTVGDRFEAVLPEAAAHAEHGSVLERDQDGESRYYLVSTTSFALGASTIGQLVVFTDVTETERHRREVERQNDQLEGFAAAIRHELLNMLQIIDGHVDLAGRRLDEGEPQAARDALATGSETADRMTRVVEDLATLARYGQTLDTTEWVAFRDLVAEVFVAAPAALTLTVEGDGQVDADPVRLGELFGEAFEFAAHNGASHVTVALLDDGFTITDDGEAPASSTAEAFFAYDAPLPDAAAGMTLPNLRMLAHVHGWEVTIDTDYRDGFRIVVTGVAVRRDTAVPAEAAAE